MAPEALGLVNYGEEPRALLFGDSPAAIERARRSAEQVGCSVAAAGPIEGAVERLEAQAHVDTVVIEAERPSAALEALLERINSAASGLRHGSVVVGPDDLIDLIAARTPHRDVFHLCRPNAVDRAAAVAFASMRRQLVLRDGKEDLQAVLQQLSDEVARIASALAAVAEEAADEGAEPREGGGKEGPPVDARMVRSVIRARRLRDRYFKGGLFADPAWDMMVDLMAARLEKHRVAVSSLCIAAAVPPTTALRWIKTLTDKGVFVRCADPTDGRRVYIELSDDAARALTAYIRAAQRISPLGF